jgi:hypothetical protein
MNSEEGVQRTNYYHVRVEGSLSDKWADWFDGFSIVSREDGSTLLTGEVPDQAALHGVLAQISRLGLSIQLVVRINCPCTTRHCPFRRTCADCMAYELECRSFPACLKPGGKWDWKLSRVIANSTERKRGR